MIKKYGTMPIAFIVDDHPMILEGICKLIGESGIGFRPKCFTTAQGCVEEAKSITPDFLIADLGLPDVDGAELACKLRQMHKGVRVMFITSYHQGWRLQNAMKFNPDCFIFKDEPVADMVTALQQLAKGGQYYSPLVREALKTLLPADSQVALTRRETQVMNLIAQGKTSKEIGEDLSISLNTVESYRKVLFQKLGVSNATKLIAKANMLGLIENS